MDLLQGSVVSKSKVKYEGAKDSVDGMSVTALKAPEDYKSQGTCLGVYGSNHGHSFSCSDGSRKKIEEFSSFKGSWLSLAGGRLTT